MSEQWNIEVPEEELKFEPPSFKPVKTGFYKAVLGPRDGSETPAVDYKDGEGDNGTWEACDFCCNSFEAMNGDKTFANYEVSGRFYGNAAVKVVNMARALNIAEKTDGGFKPLAENMSEFCEQAAAMQGTAVKVHVRTGPRRRPSDDVDAKGKRIWVTQFQDDGETPWIDSKIDSVEPL